MYKVVRNIAEVRKYLGAASAADDGRALVAFDIETSPTEVYRNEPKAALDPHKSRIVGISFSTAEKSGIYVPTTAMVGTSKTQRNCGHSFRSFSQIEMWSKLRITWHLNLHSFTRMAL